MAIQNGEFHVNGRADIVVDGYWLGYSVDGVTISLIHETDDVMTDAWGNKIPEDVLNMGEYARVTCDLIKYDHEVLRGIQNRLDDAGAEYGSTPNTDDQGNSMLGFLYKQCDEYHVVRICRGQSCTDLDANLCEGGYEFKCCIYDGEDTWKAGTRVNVHSITFRCLPNISGVLFDMSSTYISP